MTSVTLGYSSAGRLGVDDAGESITIHAPDAFAVGHVSFIEHDARRRVERLVAGLGEVVRKLLNARFMRDGGMRVGLAGPGVGRVFTAKAMDRIHFLRLGVIGLEIVVADRPLRRHAVVMRVALKILLAQAKECRAVELGCTADEVMRAGPKKLAVLVAPIARRDVAVLLEDFLCAPVFRFAREPAAAFEDEDAFARGREVPGEGAPASSATNDDDVVIGFHGSLFSG
jgi:hypothetical protein